MKKNAVVLMFDSLQYNYLGCNGNPWIKTPNFDRFAREGVTFDNCYIEGVPTVPCRRAMHTGRFTLPKAGWVALTMEDTTIADLCWGRPIDTALIFDCPMYRLPKFGYTRGFDKVWFLHGHEGDTFYYQNDPLYHLKPEDYHGDYLMENVDKVSGENVLGPLLHETTCYLKQRQYWRSDEDQDVAHVMKRAVKYLEEADRNKQFFLWVDNFDPHEPWDSPSVYDPDLKCPYDPDYTGKDEFLPIIGDVNGLYTDEELHHIRMLYAEKISMCDKWLGYFMDNFRRLGLEESTMILLVSDHGEPLGHDEHGHGIMRKCRPWPYEELVHGVMMLKSPGLEAGKRITSYTQSCDVAPTVCAWLGIGVHPSMQGKDLLPLAEGKVAKVRDFAIAGYYRYSWSLINDDWSFIHWLRDDEESIAMSMHCLYRAGIDASSAHLGGYKSTTGAQLSEEQKAYHNAASLDGEDQWTCTPGSTVEVPEADELYNRRTDPLQLNNVAPQYPEVAADLFKKLRTIIEDLRAS